MAAGEAYRRRGGVAAPIGAGAAGVVGVGGMLLGKLVVARRLVFDPARQFLGVSKRDVVQIIGHRQPFQREVSTPVFGVALMTYRPATVGAGARRAEKHVREDLAEYFSRDRTRPEK